jgi:predicted nucleotidyltransferase
METEPNTPMTPREYVEAIVLPTLHELLAARDDRRRAYLACLVVCHVADSLGLAEAAREPGFQAKRGRPRKEAVDEATKAVQVEIERRCGDIAKIVRDIANGTKHPGRLPLLPGREEAVPVFAYGMPGAGYGTGRYGVPGLLLRAGDDGAFLDVCAQQVLAAFVCAYPASLGGIALSSFVDPFLHVLGLDLRREWLPAIGAWAVAKPEIAEVWLFGSRAKGTAGPDSDVDLGLVLTPGDPGHDWPLGNWLSLGTSWREEIQAALGRLISLEAFSRPGEDPEEEEANARATAILLWTRAATPHGDPVSLSAR